MESSHQGCISENLCGISFLKSLSLKKDFSLDYTATFLIFSMFNFWKHYEENVNVLINVLFIFHVCGIYKEPSYLCHHSITIPPSPVSFPAKNLGICSIFIKCKYVNFVLSLGQAMVLARLCLRTKRGRKISSLHAHII